jgi:hypothetical protein
LKGGYVKAFFLQGAVLRHLLLCTLSALHWGFSERGFTHARQELGGKGFSRVFNQRFFYTKARSSCAQCGTCSNVQRVLAVVGLRQRRLLFSLGLGHAFIDQLCIHRVVDRTLDGPRALRRTNDGVDDPYGGRQKLRRCSDHAGGHKGYNRPQGLRSGFKWGFCNSAQLSAYFIKEPCALGGFNFFLTCRNLCLPPSGFLRTQVRLGFA